MASTTSPLPGAAALGVRPARVEPPIRPSGPPAHPDQAAWCRFFEDIYHDARSDPARIPWNDGRPNPALVAWLNAEAPEHVRPGASAVVVGCGLGHDVAELVNRGYDAVGFDVSPTAVAWAKQLHPQAADRLMVADLFSGTAGLRRRFDMVVEVYTVQAVHPELRAAAAEAISGLARPRGVVVAIARGRDESEPLPTEPPFPLTHPELEGLFAATGFRPVRCIDDFRDDEVPSVRRLRAVLRRP